MKPRLIIAIATLALVVTGSIQGDAVSSAVKAKEDYYYCMDMMRSIDIMVKNFGDKELNEYYAKTQMLFAMSGADYYSKKYEIAVNRFIELKHQIIFILKRMGQIYISRTEEMLSIAASDSFDVLRDYSKKSSYTIYLMRPIDPTKKEPPPVPRDRQHFYQSRPKIEHHLKVAYEYLEEAKKIYNNPDIENFIMEMSRKPYLSNMQNFIIDHLMHSITQCRTAKQNGIEIFKIFNKVSKLMPQPREGATPPALPEWKKKDRNMAEMTGFGINKSTIENYPIYDDRIPDEYKVDANDNRRLVHEKESVKRKQFEQKLN